MRNNPFKILFTLSIIFILSSGSSPQIVYGEQYALNDHSDFTTAEHVNFLESQITISKSNDDLYSNGINYFGLFEGDNTVPFEVNNTYLTLMTMDGEIVYEPLVYHGNSLSQISWINATTVLANYEGQPLVWNFISNTSEIIVVDEGQHHDMRYNPQTETFMVLERYIDDSINQTGQIDLMVHDRIREYTLDGDIIWQWRTSDWQDVLNFTGYYTNLNETHLSIEMTEIDGDNYPDATHSNTLYWDTNEDMVYLNIPHLNQFVKIRRGTNIPLYVAGENSEFKLLDINGTEKDSLWYGSHDLSYLGSNRFLMFDNNYRNFTDIKTYNDFSGLSPGEILTNPVYNYTQSSILVIEINETANTISEVFRWKGPENWWTTLWGSAQLLENGNYLGGFSGPVKGVVGDLLNTTFGGVAVEVTPAGDIVWQMTMPYNWGAYKVKRIKPTITVEPLASQTVNVGEIVHLEFEVFSNFPKSYRITVNGEEKETGDWDGTSVTYDVDTTDFQQGESFVSIFLMDMTGEEKPFGVEIVILYPRSPSSRGPGFEFSSFLIPILLLSPAIKKLKLNRKT